MTQATMLPGRAGIYCRLSYAPDGSVEKVERQEGDCRELAARLRWPVSEAHVFPDNSRSAWRRDRKRPQWDRMLQAIKAGEIDAIIVYHGDRLIRQPWDLELLLNIAREKGIRLASPSGTRNLDSPDDQFILRIEAAQACRESDNISRRQKRGFKGRVGKGRSQQGGKRPFGFGAPTGRFKTKVDRESGEEYEVEILDYDKPRPEETKQLAEVAARILAGLSVNGGVRYMDSVSTTTEGGPWSSKVLRSCLTAPRISGLIEHEGVLYEAAWDAVVPGEDRETLIALFDSNREAHPNPGPARSHMLSGVAECGRCGGEKINVKPMGGKRRNKKPGYSKLNVYHCPACHLARNQLHLDAYVTGRVLRLLASRRFLAELHAADDDPAKGVGAQIADLERRKQTVKTQLDQLADNPDVDPTLALTGLASFDRKISDLRGHLAATSQRRLLLRMAGISREEWTDEPIDARAEVVRSLYRVRILPAVRRGPGFDPASVELTRRPLTDAAAEGHGSQAEVDVE